MRASVMCAKSTMGKSLYEAFEDWAAGVITTNYQADEIPTSASPRAYNTALSVSAGGMTSIQKRLGMRVINATAITSSPAILGMFQFKKRAGSNYHLVVSDGGRLDKINADTTTSAADGSNATPFAAGTTYPDFAAMNNLCFMCNGAAAASPSGATGVKFDGTNAQRWGIVRPTVGTLALADAGDAGNHNGTYEARVTYYNGTTGHESSASDLATSAAITNSSINWTNIPVSADAQVTARKLYLRNTATQAYFYLAKTISDNTATTTSTNLLDAALIIRGPDTSENDPPPTGVRYAETHQQRMFVADQQKVYYSKIDLPEAFDPESYISVNADDGKVITGMLSFNGGLLVFKQDATYIIFTPDADPNTWSVELIDPIIGCTSHRSVTVAEGVARWWSLQGAVAMSGDLHPSLISLPALGPTLSSDYIALDQLGLVVSAVDVHRERVLFAVPELAQTRNTIYLPFNYRLRVWESSKWYAVDACSLVTIQDSNSIPWVFAGGYKGQVFRMWDTSNDGVGAGTKSGMVTSATASTLVSSGFTTTGAGLIERYVIATDPASTREQRRRITANTATTLTIAPDWSETPTSAWSFVVGGIDFQLDTHWMDNELAFHRKRYQFLHLLLSSSSSSVTVKLDFFFDYETDPGKQTSVNASSLATVWDTAVWDTSRFGQSGSTNHRIRIAQKGRQWKLRLRNGDADRALVFHKVGMSSELLSDKRHDG